MTDLAGTWYQWGVFVGLFVTAAVAIFIFVESQQLGITGNERLLAVILGVMGLIMTLPSLYFTLTTTRPAGTTDFAAALRLLENYDTLLNLAYLGLIGVLLALISIIYYMVTVRSASTFPPGPEPTPPDIVPPDPTPRPLPRPVVGQTVAENPEPDPMAWLIVTRGAQRNKQYPLSVRRANRVGRDPGQVDIVLNDDSVSRSHATIKFEHGRFVVYDVGSTFGTFIRNQKVQRQMLYDGDEIRMGSVEMQFKSIHK